MSRLRDKIGAPRNLALLTAAHLMTDVYSSFIVTLLPGWQAAQIEKPDRTSSCDG